MLLVPPGTIVRDRDRGNVLKDLVQPGDEVIVAKGGRGGRGNVHFKTSTNRAPRQFEPGEEGEERWISLELKVIADAGLVGFPNAGKSTLLSRVSRATPEIASYPFTTKSPNLGIVTLGDSGFVLADLPGLIEGAAQGVGLGHEFLRHVERTRVLIHLVEPFPTDESDPVHNYHAIRKELHDYAVPLDGKPEVVCVSKAELTGAERGARPARRRPGPRGAARLGRDRRGAAHGRRPRHADDRGAEARRSGSGSAQEAGRVPDGSRDPHDRLPDHFRYEHHADRRGEAVTPDVVVDIGNTRMKWGRCEAGRVAVMASLPLDEPEAWAEQLSAWGLSDPVRWAVASVNPAVSDQFREWAIGDDVLFLDHSGVPLSYAVDHPEQVGIDRLLNAFAAHCLAHPHSAVVVSVGTAATVDLIDEKGVFHGGVIFPGPRLMAYALHEHTAKLPLVDADTLPTVVAPGANTEDAILAGIRAAIVGATVLLVNHYADESEPPWVYVTGGAAGDLGQFNFGPRFEGTRTVPTLTLDGVRIAAETLP